MPTGISTPTIKQTGHESVLDSEEYSALISSLESEQTGSNVVILNLNLNKKY